ncbi:hypothetical protein GM708_17625 [Vibrio cholerae]|nr:hypothetical protein [Vibrio cholerae]
MANRAAPRKSTLAGKSPVTAATQPEPSVPAEQAPSTTTSAPRAQSPAPSPSSKKTKVAYYQDAELAARVRGAFQATAHLEDHRSFSDFHAAVMEAELERLEKKYNDGRPYKGAAPKSGRLGRPLD